MSSQCVIIGLSALVVLGLSSKIEAGNTELLGKPLFNIRSQQCREGCLEKFAVKEALCQQRPECSLCWDECAKPPPPKINKSILETWALRTVSMHRKGSLVLVDVAWAPFNTPNQCLVTWEVSGGGLMGNLLTESTNVQLSLWPDTKYRVQVTCKNKITEAMSRSLPLTIDTTEANSSVDRESSSPSTSTITTSSNIISLSSSSSAPAILSSSAASSTAPLSTLSSSSAAAAAAAAPTKDRNQSFHSRSGANDKDVLAAVDIASAPSDSVETHLNNDFDHFDWHDTNVDDNEVTVDKIAISNTADIKILTIAALSRTQTPLIYGIIAGTFLLAVILFLHVCVLRSRRIPSDKKALIDDDGNATTTILGHPSLIAGGGGGMANSGMCVTNHFGSGVPIDPVMYSRTVHVLTV